MTYPAIIYILGIDTAVSNILFCDMILWNQVSSDFILLHYANQSERGMRPLVVAKLFDIR